MDGEVGGAVVGGGERRGEPAGAATVFLFETGLSTVGVGLDVVVADELTGVPVSSGSGAAGADAGVTAVTIADAVAAGSVFGGAIDAGGGIAFVVLEDEVASITSAAPSETVPNAASAPIAIMRRRRCSSLRTSRSTEC